MNDLRTSASNCAETVPANGLPAIVAGALARQIEHHRAAWPDDLTRKALFAVNALRFTDERKPAAVKLRVRDLKAFADGYAAWAALTNS